MATLKFSRDRDRRSEPRPGVAPAGRRADDPVAAPDDDAAETTDRYWRDSSRDLRDGLEVVEKETVPGELLNLPLPRAPRGR